jgi:hydroxymethylbilane synthase
VKRIRIGTRGSKLALWQASWIARALASLPGGPGAEVVVIRTAGDETVDRPVAAIGGTGVFVKEIEEALLRGEVDVAVHSLKDLETRGPEALVLAATPARGAVEDCLVAKGPATVGSLPEGATVATGSPRRRALLRDLRPDLRFVPIRGNVPTRVDRIAAGAADATVLARAGLLRLERADAIREVLDPAAFPPAPGQGALGVQCRADDLEARDLLRILDDPPTRAAVTAERAFLRTLGSGCHLAAGAWARLAPGGATLLVDGFIGSAERTELHRASSAGPASDPDRVGASLARSLLDRASPALVRELETGNHALEAAD